MGHDVTVLIISDVGTVITCGTETEESRVNDRLRARRL